MNNAAGNWEGSKVEQETLYLIYKYLDSFTPCKEASSKLKSELEQKLLLGDVYSWDGSCKKARIKDLDRKYVNVADDHLLRLLMRTTDEEKLSLHSSIINATSSSSKCPSIDDLTAYNDLLFQLADITIKQSTQRTEKMKCAAKLSKIEKLITTHITCGEIPDQESQIGDDPSKYLKNLDANDYAEILRKGSGNVGGKNDVSAPPSCPPSKPLDAVNRNYQKQLEIKARTIEITQKSLSDLKEERKKLERESQDNEKKHKLEFLRQKEGSLTKYVYDLRQQHMDILKMCAGQTKTQENLSKSTLFAMKLTGMNKEKKFIEGQLHGLNDESALQLSSRQRVESILMSKRHISTYMSKKYHGVCNNGLEQLRAKMLGRCMYNDRSDLLSLWPGNRVAPDDNSNSLPSDERKSKRVGEHYKKLWTSSGHLLHPAYTAVIDRTGRFAITGSDDYLVKVWDIENGQLVHTCRGHKGPIVNVVLSSDNALMATACTEGTVRLWRLADCRCLKIWRHRSQINCLTFDPLTSALIYGSEGGDCVVCDLSTLLFEDDDDIDNVANGTADNNAPTVDHDMSIELAGICSQRNQGNLRFTGRYPLLENALLDMNERARDRFALSRKKYDKELPSKELPVSSYSLSNLVESRENNIDPTDFYDAMDPANSEERKVETSLTAAQEVILKSTCQLFSWNEPKRSHAFVSVVTNPIRTLCLPHINADLRGDRISVESMDICSVNSLLVTGGGDGIARVWRLNESNVALNHQLEKLDPSTKWSQVPASEGLLTNKRLEKEKSDLAVLKSLNPAICEPENIEMLETVAARQLCRLEGHVSAVTDVQFSHAGGRILTGSWKKDGTVRVWTFSKDFLKHEQMILSINENDVVDDTLSSFNHHSVGRRRGHGGQGNNKPQIHNVFWSCDDSTILVVHSFVPRSDDDYNYSDYCPVKKEGTRLRVYNSFNGKLLKIITISLQKCHVLACHPNNPYLAFTAGKEGILSVWDIRTGQQVSKHCNKCPPGGLYVDAAYLKEDSPLEIVDGKFSLDGLRIAATDAAGRLLILGNDNPDRFTNVKDSQYFLSDYSNVIHDREGWPIDADSQLPLHLAPVGPLCRTDCTPYPDQPTSFPLPQPLPMEVTKATLKQLLFWRDDYPSKLNKAYVAYKMYMMRSGDRSSSSVQRGALPSGNTISRGGQAQNPMRMRRQLTTQVDYYPQRYKRRRRGEIGERISYCEQSDNDEFEETVAVEDDEAVILSSDSEEGGCCETYVRPKTRSRAKRYKKGSLTHKSGEVLGQEVLLSNDAHSREALSHKSISHGENSTYEIAVSQHSLMANCDGCGHVSSYGSAPHTKIDNNTGKEIVCGLYMKDPRDVIRDEDRTGPVANCSGCGHLGLYKKYVPPSGLSYYKVHFVPAIDDSCNDTPRKCGEFSVNPRLGSTVKEWEWMEAGTLTGSSSSKLYVTNSQRSIVELSNQPADVTTEPQSVYDEEGELNGGAMATRIEQERYEEMVKASFVTVYNKKLEAKKVHDRIVYPKVTERCASTSGGNMSHLDRDDSEEESGADSDSDEMQAQPAASGKHGNRSKAKREEKNSVIAPWARLNGHRTVPLSATIDSAWLHAVEIVDQQYIPQMGDRVIYFPQGHMEHLQAMPEGSSPPWFVYHRHLRRMLGDDGIAGSGKWPCVECRVVDLWHDFPKSSDYKKCNSAIVEIELEIIGVPQPSLTKYTNSGVMTGNIYTKFIPVADRDEESMSFTVTLRNLNLPEFLVPFHLYMQSGQVKWGKGVKFRTFFKEGDNDDPWKSYPGVVVRSTNFDEEWPLSPWNSLEILWQENLSRVINESRIERISPWDAKLHDNQNIIAQCEKVSECSRPRLPQQLINCVLEKINDLMKLEAFEPFSYPIDSSLFADYYCIIPCAMYLDLIARRLESNFYRQLGALEFDVSLISKNCVTYNEEGSPIIADAEKLVSILDEDIKAAAARYPTVDNASSQEISRTPVINRGNSTSADSNTTLAHAQNSSEQLRLRFQSNATLRRSPGSEEARIQSSSSTSPRSSHMDEHQVENELETQSSSRRSVTRSKRKRDDRDFRDGCTSEISTRRTSRRQSERGKCDPDVPQYTEYDSDHDIAEEFQCESEDEVDRVVSVRSSRRAAKCETSPSRNSIRRNLSSSVDHVAGDKKDAEIVPVSHSSRHTQSKELLEAMSDILEYCEELDEDYRYFMFPVTDDIAPGYSDIITTPMDYSLIRNNVKALKYRSLQQLANDVMLIFDNCQLYNEDNSEVVKEAKKQRRKIKQFLHNYGL